MKNNEEFKIEEKKIMGKRKNCYWEWVKLTNEIFSTFYNHSYDYRSKGEL